MSAMRRRKNWWMATVIAWLGAVSAGMGLAQEQPAKPQEVTIERAPLGLIDPENYKIPLQLMPIRTVTIAAPTDGVVNSVLIELGKSVKAQAEVVRLKSEERFLQQKQAEAALEVSKLELDAAQGTAKTIAAARVTVAQRALELAEFRVSQTIIRSPLDGQVADILVTPGEYVQLGQPLVRVIDTTRLMVDIPVERESARAGESIEITVENQQVSGTVDAVLPPAEKFNALRDLFVSVATAHVILENQAGRLHPGQGVFSEMIPRHPVAEVPTAAVKNAGGETERKVQVIRDGFVRDLPIQLLGQIGETHVFVSARFAPGDELIISSSQELGEGSWVRPMLQEVPPEQETPSRRPGLLPRLNRF